MVTKRHAKKHTDFVAILGPGGGNFGGTSDDFGSSTEDNPRANGKINILAKSVHFVWEGCNNSSFWSDGPL